jgi:hypothetical protein
MISIILQSDFEITVIGKYKQFLPMALINKRITITRNGEANQVFKLI